MFIKNYNRGVVIVLLLSMLMFMPLLSPVVKANGIDLKIIAPQKVHAGEQFIFTLKTNNLPQYLGVSFSTDTEKAELPDNLLLSKGSENVKLKAIFFASGRHFLKVYDLKNPLNYSTVLINVLPGGFYSGSISPQFAGIISGGSIKLETRIFDRYGNMIRNLQPYFYVQNLSGSAFGRFRGNIFFANGSGECAIFMMVNNIIINEAKISVYDRLSNVIETTFTVNDPVTSTTSDYNISFVNASKKIPKGSKISIGFSKHFIMPCYCKRPITKDDIIINGKHVLSNPPKISKDFFTYLPVAVPEDILPGERVNIIVSKKTLIQNPSAEGAYNVSLLVPQYKEPLFFSNVVKIHKPITVPVFSTLPLIGGEPAKWIVHFTLCGYSLDKEGKIGVSFPFGTLLPDNPDPYLVTINGIHLLQGSKIEKYDSRTYILKLPFNIPDGNDVWIDFSNKIGIRLPFGEKVVHGSVFINFKMNKVDSKPFFVDYVPLLIVKKEIEPNISAFNGYFNKNFILRFKSYSSIPFDKVNIFYSINGGEWKAYNQEFLLNKEGSYSIRYKSVDKWGISSKEKVFNFNIDKTPPLITLANIEPVGSNKLKYVFNCSEPLSFVTVNGYYTICGFNKTFYAIFEKGEFGTLKIKAVDRARNETLVRFSP